MQDWLFIMSIVGRFVTGNDTNVNLLQVGIIVLNMRIKIEKIKVKHQSVFLKHPVYSYVFL